MPGNLGIFLPKGTNCDLSIIDLSAGFDCGGQSTGALGAFLLMLCVSKFLDSTEYVARAEKRLRIRSLIPPLSSLSIVVLLYVCVNDV